MLLKYMRFHLKFNLRLSKCQLKLLQNYKKFDFKIIPYIIFVTLTFCCAIYYLRHNDFVNQHQNIQLHRKKYIVNNKLEIEILNDLRYQVPGLGHLGQETILTGAAAERGQKDLDIHYMNVELSKQLTYNRAIEDFRHNDCIDKLYDLTSLPKTSVIIVFHNEPYSVLIRTIWSVVYTAPEQLLKEVILVDDGSNNEELKDKLEYFIKTRLASYNIRIIRLEKRTGLIQARLTGVENSKYQMIVFLDAHCECTVNWLEPLAERIKASRKNIAVPFIDNIMAETFEYDPLERDESTGGFSWDGYFTWNGISNREHARLQKVCGSNIGSCPIESPTMVGGIFAMDRNYFWELGSYDEQMKGWGGENLEMSFRIWQCGGRIESIPCSRIGHVYRALRPYENITTEDTHGRNTLRMAKVWMDSYIEFFYAFKPDLKKLTNLGDISGRQLIRKNLECKSFDWYLKNVYPEKFIPLRNAQHYGRIEPINTDVYCIDVRNTNDFDYYTELPLQLLLCERDTVNITASQFITLTNDGILRGEEDCFVQSKNNATEVMLIMCRLHEDLLNKNHWTLTDANHLQHIETNLCLDRDELSNLNHFGLRKCDIESVTQQWKFTK